MSEQSQPKPAVLQAHEQQRLVMETVGKGAERAAAAANLSGPQQEVANVAAKNLAADRAREAALTVTTGLKHTADATALESRAFLSGMGADGKRVAADASETARQTGVQQMREAYTKLILEPGKLTPPEIALLEPQVKALIAANEPQFPGLTEAFQTGGAFSRDLLINLMANPRVANALAVEMNRIYDGLSSNLPRMTQIEEQAMKAQQELAATTADRTALEARKTSIQNGPADETAFNTTAYSYVDHTGATVNVPSKAQAMTRIDGDLQASGSSDPGITNFAKNVSELRGLEAQLEMQGLSARDRQDIQKRIGERRQWIAKAENDATYGRICKEYSRLSVEKQDIEKRVDMSRDGKTLGELDKQIAAKKNDEFAKQKAVEDLQLEKNTMVGEMESAMKIALAQACAEYITEEKNAIFENYPAYEQQARSQLEEEARHIMHEALQGRYYQMKVTKASIGEWMKGKRGREVFRPVFDSARATGDIKGFCDPGFKPEIWLRGIMVGSGIKPAQADILLKDPQFVKDQMKVATQRALRAYEWKNGMGTDTIAGLVETDWGADAVDYVIRQSGAAKDLAKDYESSGGHISRSLKEQMGAGWLVKFLMFLMALGASPFAMKKT